MTERTSGQTWRAMRDRLNLIQLAEVLVDERAIWQVTEPGEEARK